MEVNVKLMGSLREKQPGGNSIELLAGASIDDLLTILSIAADQIQVVAINNHFEYDHGRKLCAGDEVIVLPSVIGHAGAVTAGA